MRRSEYHKYLASREWALKREAVRERSKGWCERCYSNAMDAVHHMTYERVGHELLSDLLAICDPCHAFLSAKSHIDPLTDGIGVYLAGSFETPWRDDLISASAMETVRKWKEESERGQIIDFIRAEKALMFGFDVTGPWRFDVGSHDHGLPQHGDYTVCSCCSFDSLLLACRSAIQNSDIIFAWLPDTRTVPAGTLWEMGYAAAINKMVVAGRPGKSYGYEDEPDRGDYWFPILNADVEIVADSAKTAWEKFCQTEWRSQRRSRITAPAWIWRTKEGVNLNL